MVVMLLLSLEAVKRRQIAGGIAAEECNEGGPWVLLLFQQLAEELLYAILRDTREILNSLLELFS